jgi:Tfp pilus assembly ATPase PilU
MIQTSQRDGMKTMNQALCELYSKGLITYENAVARSSIPDELDKTYRRHKIIT